MGKRKGFNKWGWGDWDWMFGKEEKGSVSKWEKSYYGGYYRLVSEYPRVVIDSRMEFDFADMKYLAYFEKEKICKIFLSKAKTHGLIPDLMVDASTTNETDMTGSECTVTTISKNSKSTVISELMKADIEYAPLFKYYQKFIRDTVFSFKTPEGQDQNQNKGGNQNSESENQDQKKQGW